MRATPENAVSEKLFVVANIFGAKLEKIDPSALFLSTLCVCISRMFNLSDLLVGYRSNPAFLPQSLRSRLTSNNVLPFHVTLDKKTPIAEFIDGIAASVSRRDESSQAFPAIKFFSDKSAYELSPLFDLEYIYDYAPMPRRQSVFEAGSLNVMVRKMSAAADAHQILVAFNDSKYPPGQIDKLNGLWTQLLRMAITGVPADLVLHDLQVLDEAELHQVTQGFNQTMHDYPVDKCMPDLLREQVKQQPHNVAIIYHDRQLTFAELDEYSHNIAIYLQHAGVEPDDCIGIFAEPSLDLMIGVWGVLLSGAAYLPLSPDYPDGRVKYMIFNSQIRTIFTQEKLKEKLKALAPSHVRIVTLNGAREFQKPKGNCPAKDFQSSHLAYVIYTSGSTGKPKGVMIEQHSIVNQMCWLKDAFKLGNQSVILQKTPMSFDAAQWELLAPACGATVVLGSPGLYRQPTQMIGAIIRHKVTVLQCVPTLLQALLDTGEFHNCTSLTQLFVGGEALPKHLVMECQKTLPECEVINLYGPTECTINTSAYCSDRASVAFGPDTISIGAPIANTQYFILDQCNSPVGIGAVGELYIGGAGVGRGYLHQPEMTAQRFVTNPFSPNDPSSKLYKTGDLARWNADGTVQYAGRADNQVKIRGFRIELDEIKSAIETHEWIKHSAVIAKVNPHTGYQNLIAFIELDPREAALMDQGNHDSHHQSKESKAQILLQLSNKGCREGTDLRARPAIDLPGKIPTARQREEVFGRKTYRFFEGGPIQESDILRLLEQQPQKISPRALDSLSYTEFGEILRYFGQFRSEERLLPKYGYASPGALYPTQMYLEINRIGDLTSGYYYYYPVHHQLFLVRQKAKTRKPEIKLHFVGKKSAIEPIYKHNILEVMEIETGHIVGLFEQILPRYGMSIEPCDYHEKNKLFLDAAEEDFYLGTFAICAGKVQPTQDNVDLYVQIHPGKISGLTGGQYQMKEGRLAKISDELILKKHVIAINQGVYERSSFGITAISRTSETWMDYIHLGKTLQKLQMNNINLGFMSSGYSSKSGHDLPSAKQIQRILNSTIGPSHFFIGGRISDEQKRSEGMKEDAVHMRGPAEIIKDDLTGFLPEYMIPNQVVVLDRMPLTVNGKIDFQELRKHNVELIQREYIAPRSELELKICNMWKTKIKREEISVGDNFFELGGNSLIAVSLVNEMNQRLNCSLPLQIIFEFPTVEKLALRVSSETEAGKISSRLVPLQAKGRKVPVYCWPGLGGYCMNLKLLARELGTERPFYGVQVYGINKNETPWASLEEMASEDIKMIRELQPRGPYALWGYSFGARVAFEAAWQLEQCGEIVKELILIAPGSPMIEGRTTFDLSHATYSNTTYLTILFSVFMGTIAGSDVDECLQTVHDEKSFVEFITRKNDKLERDLVTKIIGIVAQTYGLKPSIGQLKKRRLDAPVTVVRAKGDEYSFAEEYKTLWPTDRAVIELEADHYSMLKNPGIHELVRAIRHEQELL